MKVFLDANILFSDVTPRRRKTQGNAHQESGSVSGSKIAKLVEIAKQHGECVTNLYAVEEARKNIERKKYGSIKGNASQDTIIINIDKQMDNTFNKSIAQTEETSACLDFKYDPNARPIWEIAAEISAQIPDSEWAKVPTDLAKNFDKYQTETATEDGE